MSTPDADNDHILRLQDEIASLKSALYYQEQNLKFCQDISMMTKPSKEEHANALDEFIAIFTKQYLGILVGVLAGLLFRFLDQIFASHFAKRHNLRQKEIMQAAFPTFICFMQYLLRRKSKNSKLAALLSHLKQAQTEAENSQIDLSKVAHCPKSKSVTRRQTNSSSSRPAPLSSLSSCNTGCDAVFHSPLSKSKSKRKAKNNSVSVSYKRDSNVVITVSNSPKK